MPLTAFQAAIAELLAVNALPTAIWRRQER